MVKNTLLKCMHLDTIKFMCDIATNDLQSEQVVEFLCEHCNNANYLITASDHVLKSNPNNKQMLKISLRAFSLQFKSSTHQQFDPFICQMAFRHVAPFESDSLRELIRIILNECCALNNADLFQNQFSKSSDPFAAHSPSTLHSDSKILNFVDGFTQGILVYLLNEGKEYQSILTLCEYLSNAMSLVPEPHPSDAIDFGIPTSTINLICDCSDCATIKSFLIDPHQQSVSIPVPDHKIKDISAHIFHELINTQESYSDSANDRVGGVVAGILYVEPRYEGGRRVEITKKKEQMASNQKQRNLKLIKLHRSIITRIVVAAIYSGVKLDVLMEKCLSCAVPEGSLCHPDVAVHAIRTLRALNVNHVDLEKQLSRGAIVKLSEQLKYNSVLPGVKFAVSELMKMCDDFEATSKYLRALFELDRGKMDCFLRLRQAFLQRNKFAEWAHERVELFKILYSINKEEHESGKDVVVTNPLLMNRRMLDPDIYDAGHYKQNQILLLLNDHVRMLTLEGFVGDALEMINIVTHTSHEQSDRYGHSNTLLYDSVTHHFTCMVHHGITEKTVRDCYRKKLLSMSRESNEHAEYHGYNHHSKPRFMELLLHICNCNYVELCLSVAMEHHNNFLPQVVQRNYKGFRTWMRYYAVIYKKCGKGVQFENGVLIPTCNRLKTKKALVRDLMSELSLRPTGNDTLVMPPLTALGVVSDFEATGPDRLVPTETNEIFNSLLPQTKSGQANQD
ncbi:hypothetical protein AKO1_008273, partial [Acrasis kona]